MNCKFYFWMSYMVFLIILVAFVLHGCASNTVDHGYYNEPITNQKEK